MKLLQRIQDILLRPKTTWPTIAAEPDSARSLYTRYVMILALVPPLASVLGLSMVGMAAFGVSVHVPVLVTLASALASYLASLLAVYLVALVVDALAPAFGGVHDRIGALKLVVYASTAAFLGGVFNLLPLASGLGLLAALYGVYLVYTGLPALMKCPPGKAALYTTAVSVCGVLVALALAALINLVLPGPLSHIGAIGNLEEGKDSGPKVSIQTPGGSISLDAGKMEEATRRMEEAGKKMQENASSANNPQAAGKAAAEAMATLSGQARTVPIDAQVLRSFLPETLAGMKRDSVEAQSGGAAGVTGTSARARYRDGKRRVDLAIIDAGGLGALMAAATWASVTLDRETDTRVEKVYKEGKRTVREDYAKDGSRAEYMVVLANGVLIEARGRGLDIAALRAALGQLDLDRIEALQRPEKPGS